MLKDKYIYIFTLIVVAISTHLQWINLESVLTFADWGYWSSAATKHLWLNWATWYPFMDFGSPNIQISFIFFKTIWGVTQSLGGSYDTAVKATFLIPIMVMGALSPYYYGFYLTKDRTIAFVGAIFYMSTTFFIIRQTAHLPIAFVYALTPLLLMTFDRAFIVGTAKAWSLFMFLFVLGGLYEIRILYLVCMILFLQLIIVRADLIIKNIQKLFIVGTLFVLLNLFWILPVVLGNLSGDISEVANRGLFGNHLFTIEQSLTLFESSWTDGYPNMDFEPQPIPIRFWIIPILAVLAIITATNNQSPFKKVIFFSLVTLLGVLLSKQADVPGDGIYEWLYHNFPGFNLFREASKFYLFTSIGYFGLITILLLNIKKYTVYFYGICFSVVVLGLLNLLPLLNGDIKTMFISREIPSDYVWFSGIVDNDLESFKTLWIPTQSRWAPFSAIHPKISAVNLLDKYADSLFYDLNNNISDQRRDLQFESIMSSKLFSLIIKAGSIKYIGVPLRDIENDDNFFRFFGEKYNSNIHSWYIQLIDSVPEFRKVTSNSGNLAVYEGNRIRPVVSSVDYLIKFPTFAFIEQYLAFIKNVTGEVRDFITYEDAFESTKFPHLTTRDIFEGTNLNDMYSGRLVSSVDAADDTKLYYPKDSGVLVNEAENLITLSGVSGSNEYDFVHLSKSKRYSVEYIDSSYEYANLISNPSFETGLWQEKVGDCNNADDYRQLAMNQSTVTSTDGQYSLELSATRHIACTHQADIPVTGGKSYLLQFDYQSPNSAMAGFYLTFGGEDSISKRIGIGESNWQTYRRIIRIPSDTKTAELFVYSYDSDQERSEQIVRYDNFHLIELPDVVSRFYSVDYSAKLSIPKEVTFNFVNPTKKLAHIAGATTPFYLTMSEAYHLQWQAELNNEEVSGWLDSWIPWVHPDTIPESYHFKLDGFLNGWYVDPVELCGTKENLKEGCSLNEDGSYNIELIIEFTPQRWFYVGLIISGLTLASCLGYLGYSGIRSYRQRKALRQS